MSKGISVAKVVTNPNGANQYVLDPRQKLCWELYITPGTPCFGNATKSAFKAGYTKYNSSHVSQEEWFRIKLRRLGLLEKAEKVLEETLTMSDEQPFIVSGKTRRVNDDGDDEEESEPVIITKRDPQLTRIKQDSAKFIAERQGKNEGYSTRSEVTGADGSPLIPHDPEAAKKAKEAIDKFLGNERDTGNTGK